MKCYGGFLEYRMLLGLSCWLEVEITQGVHQITASVIVADYLLELFASIQIDCVRLTTPPSAYLKASWSLASYPLKTGLPSFLPPSFSNSTYEQPHAGYCSFYA
jgi:hypothetical protein